MDTHDITHQRQTVANTSVSTRHDGHTETVAEAIKSAREAQGWSKSDLARRLGTGYRTVHRWETGETIPGGPRLHTLASVLGMKLERLVALVSSAEPSSAEWQRFIRAAADATPDELQSVRMTPLGDDPTAEDYAEALALQRRISARKR
jgi:ribosome-binding protein aMBF1 (putative translation factor)